MYGDEPREPSLESQIMNGFIKGMMSHKKAIVILFCLWFVYSFGANILTNAVYTVSSGDIGIMTTLGKAEYVVQPGAGIMIPFIQSVKTMPVRVAKLQVDCDSASKDLQTITTTVAVNYRIDAVKAMDIFTTLGTNYAESVISPAIEESVKSATAGYTAENLITQREIVKQAIVENLDERLKKYNIIVSDVNIVNFQFSAQFNNAIESKQVAEQQTQEQKNILNRKEIEAQQILVAAKANADSTLLQAKANADATLLQAEAEAQAMKLKRETLTDELIKIELIRKWNGNVPQTTSGDFNLMKILGE